MNRENLTKLLKALKSKKKLPAKLDMRDFSGTDEDWATRCGSVGCLVGISSYIIEPKGQREDWVLFSSRIFDVSASDITWDFLFASRWAINRKTNTKAHAIKRIEYVLNNAHAPKNWNYNWGIK